MKRKRVVKKVLKKKSDFSSSKDFSNKAVVIMLIVVIVVSILSLGFYLTVLNESMQSQSKDSPVQTQGAVTLEIISPPEKAERSESAEGNSG